MTSGEVIFQGSEPGQSLTLVPAAGPQLPSLRHAPPPCAAPGPSHQLDPRVFTEREGWPGPGLSTPSALNRMIKE